jgi:hypothetical protein
MRPKFGKEDIKNLPFAETDYKKMGEGTWHIQRVDHTESVYL